MFRKLCQVMFCCRHFYCVRIEPHCKHRSIEFLTTQTDQSKGDILIDYVLIKVPFVMYYDLESLIPPIPHGSGDLNSSYTNLMAQHIPCGWSIRSHFAYGEVTNPEASYRGPNCIETLCEHLISETHRLYKSFPRSL